MESESDGDLIGKTLLGKLEVKRRLGGGGMGVVYEVEHRLTGHRRALKLVHAKYADRPRFMKRLLREAKVAGTLETKHVVETYDAGRLEDGSAYVLMELLRGRSLYEAMQAEGKMAAKRMANIMTQVAEGMALAHEAGIIHRDLKPENIFLIEDGDGHERVKILDFGVSKFEASAQEAPNRLTAEGTLVGTPYYMSPEQATGKPVDPRSDVYAIGVILYEGLTGRLPFEADSVGALFVKIGAGECVPLRIRRPDVGDAWHRMVHKCFHRDPAQRYQTVEALRRDLVERAGSATASRARTISDGGRSTVDYIVDPSDVSAGEVITADPPSPKENEEDDASEVLSAAPAKKRAGGKAEPRQTWQWVLAAAAVMLAFGVPWALTQTNEAAGTPGAVLNEVETEPELPVADAPAGVEPAGGGAARTEPSPEPASQDAGVPARRATRRPNENPRRNTRATAAGLDPNPYR